MSPWRLCDIWTWRQILTSPGRQKLDRMINVTFGPNHDLSLTSLDQSTDVRQEFWRPLDVLGMSGMSCKCQILTKPVPCELTSLGCPGDVSECHILKCNSDVTGTSPWGHDLTSREWKKVFTKFGNYDVQNWHHTDQGPMSPGRPGDVRLLAGMCLQTKAGINSGSAAGCVFSAISLLTLLTLIGLIWKPTWNRNALIFLTTGMYYLVFLMSSPQHCCRNLFDSYIKNAMLTEKPVIRGPPLPEN